MDDVARDLVGCFVLVGHDATVVRARLVETEAYGGADDPASHAYRGATPRSSIMFGPAGYLYVYRIYGLHWCANVVTGAPGDASAVLLRAAEFVDAVADTRDAATRLRGPGNLTRGLGITGADTGTDCCAEADRRVWFERGDRGRHETVAQSTRVGLTKGVERPSRYFLLGHAAVSGPRSRRRRTGGASS